MTLPFKERLTLLQHGCRGFSGKVSSIADLQIGEGNQQAAVGTAVICWNVDREQCQRSTKEFTQHLKTNLN